MLLSIVINQTKGNKSQVTTTRELSNDETHLKAKINARVTVAMETMM